MVCCGLTSRGYSSLILSIITACLFADQNLMSPNLTLIAKDFNFTDAERDTKLGGEIALGFFLVGAPVSLIIGFLADKMNRKLLYTLVVLLGEGPCLLTYFVTTYQQLFWLRTLTGVAVGGALPLIYSMYGDLYSAKERNMVSSLVLISVGFGGLTGQSIAGYVGDRVGWRLPFVIVSAPGLVAALLFFFTTKEPVRGQAEVMEADVPSSPTAAAKYEKGKVEPASEAAEHQGGYHETVTWAKFWGIWKIKTNLLIFAQGLPGCVPWGLAGTFLIDYLAVDKGYGKDYATTISLVQAAGGAMGSILGGFLGQRIYNFKKGHLGIFMGVFVCAGTFPALAIVNWAMPGWLELTVAFFGGLIQLLSAANVRATLVNVNSPETRGSVFSYFNIMDDIGKGLGPFFGAQLIVTFGRATAFNVGMSFFFICGFFLLLTVFTIEADANVVAANVQKVLKDGNEAAAGKANTAMTAVGKGAELSVKVENPLVVGVEKDGLGAGNPADVKRDDV